MILGLSIALNIILIAAILCMASMNGFQTLRPPTGSVYGRREPKPPGWQYTHIGNLMALKNVPASIPRQLQLYRNEVTGEYVAGTHKQNIIATIKSIPPVPKPRIGNTVYASQLIVNGRPQDYHLFRSQILREVAIPLFKVTRARGDVNPLFT